MAVEARTIKPSAGIKKQAASITETACPIQLPRLDEFRTYCYENVIEEIPSILNF
jgi:hypothetical protein